MTSNVERLIALEKKLAADSLEPIDGLYAFALTPDGKILATRHTEIATETVLVDPSGRPEWERRVERLKNEAEFRHLFGSVSDAEFAEYLAKSKTQTK